jgi:hypothetical protein
MGKMEGKEISSKKHSIGCFLLNDAEELIVAWYLTMEV